VEAKPPVVPRRRGLGHWRLIVCVMRGAPCAEFSADPSRDFSTGRREAPRAVYTSPDSGINVLSRATYSGTGLSTVRQWELGEKHPGGPSRKHLDLLDRKGLEALI
jgi:hypothetical protein